ncbi:hypothetical protein [Paenibacillus silvisoli]|uniref:hypothetical protein n=1 Tax=Paenibacillus silvisoli TaxID=3110539 RepID=UPI0028045C9B|nr:hypothetical protein [Paenibacillus silvisoli]
MLKIDSYQKEKKVVLDTDYVCLMLQDYLNGKNSSHRYKELEHILPDEDDRTWGINVYTSLTKVLNQENVPGTTLRSFHALMEHKKLMVSRLEYINNNYAPIQLDLIEGYKQIEADSTIARNLLIKSYNNKSSDIQQRLTRKLNDLQGKERDLLPEIIYCLEKRIPSF